MSEIRREPLGDAYERVCSENAWLRARIDILTKERDDWLAWAKLINAQLGALADEVEDQ